MYRIQLSNFSERHFLIYALVSAKNEKDQKSPLPMIRHQNWFDWTVSGGWGIFGDFRENKFCG